MQYTEGSLANDRITFHKDFPTIGTWNPKTQSLTWEDDADDTCNYFEGITLDNRDVEFSHVSTEGTERLRGKILGLSQKFLESPGEPIVIVIWQLQLCEVESIGINPTVKKIPEHLLTAPLAPC